MSEPLSPKTPGTLVRAKKGAVPLRQEVQDKVDALQRRALDIKGCGDDLGTAMQGLEDSLQELEGRIQKEFEDMKSRLQEQMDARCAELIAGAKDHFDQLNKVMAQQREMLSDEDTRVKASVEEGLEALGLDDAWFIQAYPDIQMQPGASTVGRAREVLNGGNGALGLSFDERVMTDVLVPAVRGHGKLTSSLSAAANTTAAPAYSPRSSPQQRSPRSPKQEKVFSAQPVPESPVDGSVLEKQVETMLKTVN